MKLLSEIDVSQKRVFLRADLDVPIEEFAVDPSKTRLASGGSSQFTEATRLQNLRPTVDYLFENGADKVIIGGHLDRPKGFDPALSTKQLLEPLERILGQEIVFSSQLKSSVNREPTTDNHIVLLENLRFWPGEVKNDQTFAQQLAKLADVYINEAFGNCHRSHSSMVALPALLPHAAGLHLEKEIEELTGILKDPKKPFVAIVGGAKIETKLPLVENLAKIADLVLVGGELPIEIRQKNMKLKENVLVAQLTEDGKDINQESIDAFIQKIKTAQTIVWNGPLGLFEEGYKKGTIEIAQAILKSPAYEIIGGGETVQFLIEHQLLSKFSFVSSGGGAMLEFLSGEKLPGIKALE